MIDFWVQLIGRVVVDSVLPAAGLLAATAGILFAIYYWTRLGKDRLLSKCAIIAVLLHLIGFLSLFKLPFATATTLAKQEVRIPLELRSEDELRGEDQLADLESSRSDLPEPAVEPEAPETKPDDLARPERDEKTTPLPLARPSLEETPLPLVPKETLEVDAAPIAEETPRPIQERSIEPQTPTVEPSTTPETEPDRPDLTTPEEPSLPSNLRSPDSPSMRLVEPPPSTVDAPAPAPMHDVDEASVAERRVLPPDPTLSAEASSPEESNVPARPTDSVPDTVDLPAPARPSTEPEPILVPPVTPPPPSVATLPTPSVPEPAEPDPSPRFQTETTMEPATEDEPPTRPEPTMPEDPTFDAAALARRLTPAPVEIEGPRTFWENRIAPNRMEIVYRHGGSQETEKAVATALEWLATHQSEDGRWDSDGFDLRCPDNDKCEGHAIERDSDTGLTGLSLLAFLGAGHTHLSDSKYRETVRRGLSWLLRTQRPDGDLRYGGRIYAHSMATISITEAFAMTKDQRLKAPAQRAILWLAEAQHVESGSWRYNPRQEGDTSVYGWAILALRSARLAGLDVPESTWLSARRWLPSVVSGRNKGLASYQPGFPPSHAMTAEALFCRQVLEGQVERNVSSEASAYLLERLPDAKDYHLYYWYYGTLSLFQLGGPSWERWNERLTATLLGSQKTQGHAKGSWDPQSPFGVDGGRVFATSCSCLCLEVYYRYLPLYQSAAPAASEPVEPFSR